MLWCIGIGLGVLTDISHSMEAAASLNVLAFCTTPTIALVPITSLRISFDAAAQIVIIVVFVTWSVFVTWPVVVNIFQGVTNGGTHCFAELPYVTAGATPAIAMDLVGVIDADPQTQISDLDTGLEIKAQTSYHTTAPPSPRCS